MKPAALIDLVAGHLNQASPEMAVFRKTGGAGDELRRGDEFVVRMPGPWETQLNMCVTIRTRWVPWPPP